MVKLSLRQSTSSRHEIDLVLVEGAQDGMRSAHNQIVLGVGCKAYTNFRKKIIRQVLGVRRELSLLNYKPSRPRLFLCGQLRLVEADPLAEFWLAFEDPKGMKYRFGPKVFGIDFKYWCPP